MATSADIVTRALRRLQAIDINEQPSSAEMTHGLACLSELINQWSFPMESLALQTMDATTVSGDQTIVVEDTSSLAVGLNVSGTGITTGAYITEITNETDFEISAAATASGEDVELSFTPVPFPVKHEGAIVALLAVRVAGDEGLPDAPPRVVQDAVAAEYQLLAAYTPDPLASFDGALTDMPSQRKATR